MPILWLCLTFIAGLLFSTLFFPPVWVWPLLLLLSLSVVWLEYKISDHQSHPLLSHKLIRIPFSLLAASFVLGAWLYQFALPNPDQRDLSWYSPSEHAIVRGTVISYPEESPSSTVAIVQAQSINARRVEKAVQGKLELRLPGGFNLSYGDVLILEGPLDSALDPNEQPYTSYLARKGIYNRMQYPEVRTVARDAGNPIMAAIYQLREESLQIIYEQIPFPESALLAGILLGVDWVIPDIYQEAYRACGVLHIIAISGFNIAVISTIITRLTGRIFTPAKAGIIAIIAIAVYTLMVGAEPAVVRAAIMGSLVIPASLIGRRVIALHSLVLVAAIMLVGNPFLLWDASYQLSFLACVGLITMVDPLERWTGEALSYLTSEKTSRWITPIAAWVISTLAAQFAVLPVSLKLDAQLSVFSLPANLALLPVQPVLMILGGILVICGFFSPFLSSLLARAVWPFLAYCNRIALHFGFQPHAEIESSVLSRSSWIILIIVASTLVLFSFLQIRSYLYPQQSGQIEGQ